MKEKTIVFYAINLPGSVERRENVERQAAACDIDIQIVEAVSGATLTEEQKAMYDAVGRMKNYERHLTPNEQACVHSHRKVLEMFLASGAEYAVVMEDDVTLGDKFMEALRFLTERLGGWEFCKLYSDPGPLYEVFTHNEEDPLYPMFPKKFRWTSPCNMYTRRAAEFVLRESNRFFLPADAQIGSVLMQAGLPSICLNENVAGVLNPNNEQSDIDAGGARSGGAVVKRSLVRYIRYRLSIAANSLAKSRMCRILRRSLHYK